MLDVYQTGMDDCVAKPVSPALFIAKVRDWLRHAWIAPPDLWSTLPAGDMRLDLYHRSVKLRRGEGACSTQSRHADLRSDERFPPPAGGRSDRQQFLRL